MKPLVVFLLRSSPGAAERDSLATELGVGAAHAEVVASPASERSAGNEHRGV